MDESGPSMVIARRRLAFVLFVRGVDATYLIVGGGALGAAAYVLL